MNKRHEITDEEWNKIKHYFPKKTCRTLGRPAHDARTMLNGMLWITRTGAPWRDLPERYGKWNSVYKRFSKWADEGLFATIFKELICDVDMQDVSLDSTSCKAHQHSAGAKKGTQMTIPTRTLD